MWCVYDDNTHSVNHSANMRCLRVMIKLFKLPTNFIVDIIGLLCSIRIIVYLSTTTPHIEVYDVLCRFICDLFRFGIITMLFFLTIKYTKRDLYGSAPTLLLLFLKSSLFFLCTCFFVYVNIIVILKKRV